MTLPAHAIPQTIRICCFLVNLALIPVHAFLFLLLQKINSLFNVLGSFVQVTLYLAVIYLASSSCKASCLFVEHLVIS